MPFGSKPDASGALIDFDAVYSELIAPAIRQAGLEPLRADEEMAGGIIHKAMFERLLLCEYAVADLTTANANVFYELGVRHAARPCSTVLIFAEGRRLPFDVALMRAVPYRLNEGGLPADTVRFQTQLAAMLQAARTASQTDSPVFTFLTDWKPVEIDHAKTDVFRDRVRYSERLKERLAQARREGAEALRRLDQELQPIADQESGVVIDLFLSYRAVKAWGDMIGLVEGMALPLQATVMVQEQLALALNRAGEGERAESILLDLIQKRGPSSETYGILGRVYKDRWERARQSGNIAGSRGLLRNAADAYLRGFEADWRDAYPGINAITLMELSDPPDPRREGILPVVRYSVERRIRSGRPDYWDHATLLELAVLGKDESRARVALEDAAAAVRASWEPETTLRNLRLIREAREERGEVLPWVLDVENSLSQLAEGR